MTDSEAALSGLFESVFELSPLAIVVTSLSTHRVVEANQSAVEVLGIPRDQLIGNDLRIGHVDPAVRAQVTADLEAGRPVRGQETYFERPDGDRRIIQYSSSIIEVRGDRALMSLILDVTERRRAERRLDVQLQVAAILSASASIDEAAPKLLTALCSTQRWQSGRLSMFDSEVNAERVVATYGRPVEAPAETLTFDIAHGEERIGHVDLISDRLRGVDDQLRAVCAAVGRQIGMFVTRIRSTRELQRSHERLGAVMESMAEGLVVGTPEGDVIHWNPAALELHGFTSSADWEKSLASFGEIMELSPLDAPPLALDEWPMARIIRGEKLRNVLLVLRRKDIAWERVFVYGGSLVTIADGSQIVVVTIADATERTRALRELQTLNAELEMRVDERTASLSTANAELEAFTYSVSHDLRAPLRAIRGFAEMVATDHSAALPAEARGLLEKIQARGERMSTLIGDLLDLSKIVRRPMSRRPTDMTALAKEALAEVLPEPGPYAVEIEELPAANADASLVRQVWLNLIGNAVKFSRERSIPRVVVGCRLSAPPAYFVRDNGAGFVSEDAARLFVPFQRLHEQQFEGTGVGLALVHRIVARHGGRVWAEAEPDRGATFYFTLSAARDPGDTA